MIAIQTILHPTDFSDVSESACRFASALARDYGAKLIVVHVWQRAPVVHCRAGAIPVADPDQIRAEVNARLAEWRSHAHDVADEPLLLEGDPCEVILRVAAERHCDLIVMGTHGRSGLDRIVLGSVAEHVLRRAPCPVLTIRTAADHAPRNSADAEWRDEEGEVHWHQEAPAAVPTAQRDGSPPFEQQLAVHD